MEDQLPKTNNTNKVLRTFSSDMAEAVRENEMSVIKIALAEKERREQEDLYKKAKGTKLSRFLFVFLGLIIISGSAFGAYYFIKQNNIKKEKEFESKKIQINTFLSYSNAHFIDALKIYDSMSLISAINERSGTDTNGINAIFLTKINEAGEKTPIDKDTFLSSIKASTPDSLKRSMDPDFLLGKVVNKESNENSQFLIFKINNYGQAYSTMLDWERTLLKDLFIIFNINIPESDNSIFEKSWADLIINNKDVRVLLGQDGEGILFYSFINKKTLVITTSKNALNEIMYQVFLKETKS